MMLEMKTFILTTRTQCIGDAIQVSVGNGLAASCSVNADT